MNYEEDMQIDESSLDIEWLNQPSLMFKYIKHQAKTQRDEEEAENSLSILKAELDAEIRTNPEKFDIEKLTEKAVEAAILSTQDYQDGLDALLSFRYENNMAKAAVRSADQRRSALENLVKLYLAGYFSGPNVPRDITYEVQQKKLQSDVDSGIAKKLVRRNK